ncbi:growth arrest-specific protein 2-like [Anneissia japonica]|uniref:growth arrest-specific protein 2-like n=1 Tax=Anneissia japonica TaxID=1529436 RepID=UPI00142589C2|nr:growth arrest-specific protein 2-like [Anneissia japonica]XP_033101749.1 growth arrest-specific protein 2-like [Anneissia japonica]
MFNGTMTEHSATELTSEIAKAAEEALIPLQDDLADWLSRVLDVDITTGNFMESLSDGVLPCKLALLLQNKAEECKKRGLIAEDLPRSQVKYRANARRGSFFARDNTASFLKWCREIGLEDTCLFETEGLVLQKQPKDVLVCIYELARIAARYGIEPPGLVKLEKEIEREQTNPRPVSAIPKAKRSPVGALDVEVMKVANKSGHGLQIKRISEGRYNIAGKVVFIRMLRGRHVMVRVGGGWDTLEHFLEKHDACKMVRVSRQITDERGVPVPDDFFVINARYKGSPPSRSRPGSTKRATSR